jgi:hypothetical protein
MAKAKIDHRGHHVRIADMASASTSASSHHTTLRSNVVNPLPFLPSSHVQFAHASRHGPYEVVNYVNSRSNYQFR